ncbi:YjbQ family protein [Candidatus Woesearchaeota archaeon]|nr:YjbQ family protein [Candidatus Woesearchaeota archaeon]
MAEIIISTTKKNELVDITQKIQEKVDINQGICVVYCPHTTAGLTINEGTDPAVKSDIVKTLKKIVPYDLVYSHMEGNSAAHIKASLFGNFLNVIVENKRLKLGTWQKIFFVEADGPRNRKIWIKFIS